MWKSNFDIFALISFAQCTTQCYGNVHEERVVKVTASICDGDSDKPKNAVDLKSDSLFESKDSPNSWICYEFKRDPDELLDKIVLQLARLESPQVVGPRERRERGLVEGR